MSQHDETQSGDEGEVVPFDADTDGDEDERPDAGDETAAAAGAEAQPDVGFAPGEDPNDPKYS
jgi:hypothetical protein